MRHLVIAVLVSFAAAAPAARGAEGAPASVASPKAAAAPDTEAPADPDALEIRCAHGSDERALIIVPKGSGCELHYQKLGKTDIKASALNEPRVCERVRNQIRKTLEGSGFACR